MRVVAHVLFILQHVNLETRVSHTIALNFQRLGEELLIDRSLILVNVEFGQSYRSCLHSCGEGVRLVTTDFHDSIVDLRQLLV